MAQACQNGARQPPTIGNEGHGSYLRKDDFLNDGGGGDLESAKRTFFGEGDPWRGVRLRGDLCGLRPLAGLRDLDGE